MRKTMALAQALEPDRIEGHFSMLIALGMYSEAIGSTRALPA